MDFFSYGWKYLKTGDYIGYLCPKCNTEMYIDKTGRKWNAQCPCGNRLSIHKVIEDIRNKESEVSL